MDNNKQQKYKNEKLGNNTNILYITIMSIVIMSFVYTILYYTSSFIFANIYKSQILASGTVNVNTWLLIFAYILIIALSISAVIYYLKVIKKLNWTEISMVVIINVFILLWFITDNILLWIIKAQSAQHFIEKTEMIKKTSALKNSVINKNINNE